MTASSVLLECFHCGRDTDHLVRGQYITTVPPEENPPPAEDAEPILFTWTILQIIECETCGRPDFRQGWTLTPHVPESWAWSPRSEIPRDRWPLRAGNCLPSNVVKLYRETCSAFRCGALTLAAGGLRATVEAICIDRHCKGDCLQQKIKKLGTVLSPGDVHLLQTNRALGNAAVHQMETPSPGEISAALDILEHLLKTLYQLPRRAEELKRLRTARLNPQPSPQLSKAS